MSTTQRTWRKKIRLGDIFHNEDMTFEQRRDAIVARLRASGWLRMRGEDMFDSLGCLFEELSETEDADEFDCVWDAIYDEADWDRVWIDTIIGRDGSTA